MIKKIFLLCTVTCGINMLHGMDKTAENLDKELKALYGSYKGSLGGLYSNIKLIQNQMQDVDQELESLDPAKKDYSQRKKGLDDAKWELALNLKWNSEDRYKMEVALADQAWDVFNKHNMQINSEPKSLEGSGTDEDDSSQEKEESWQEEKFCDLQSRFDQLTIKYRSEILGANPD